jgi:hypothetical protein
MNSLGELDRKSTLERDESSESAAASLRDILRDLDLDLLDDSVKPH